MNLEFTHEIIFDFKQTEDRQNALPITLAEFNEITSFLKEKTGSSFYSNERICVNISRIICMFKTEKVYRNYK